MDPGEWEKLAEDGKQGTGDSVKKLDEAFAQAYQALAPQHSGKAGKSWDPLLPACGSFLMGSLQDPGWNRVLKMKDKKLWGLAAGVGLFFIFFFASPIYAQKLSQIYVSPAGYVLGAIFDADPGFSSDIYVSNAGQLVWIEMEIPRALLEVYSDGYIRLIEEGPSANVDYEDGMIRRIGDVRFHYDNGRVREIMNLRFEYESGQLRRMGDLRFHYDEYGRIRSIGNLRLSYANERLHKIGDLTFHYDENGLIQNIDGVRFDYEYGRLKKVTGNIPGVGITVTWVVEFRKKLPKY